MNRRLLVPLILICFISAVVLAEDVKIPDSLRGGIKADQQTINTALQMQKQGWSYTMPSPKSKQAAWGNKDGRTTWYDGYWYNEKTKLYSTKTPELKDGVYAGNGEGGPGKWRRGGGSPDAPTKLEWLLSKDGGIQPKD